MNTFSCVIIDDEPIARDILKQYIQKDERLKLESSYSNAADAIKTITNNKPELLFLDIKMPKISGFDLIRSLPPNQHVIFTTAYREFALEGFDLNAIDYLLKPFSFDRFRQAVNKACMLLQAENGERNSPSPLMEEEKDLFVKSAGKLVRIRIQDILYIEALKEYVRIFTNEGSWVVYQTMQSFEEKLPKDSFYRIHRSYIVGLKHVRSIEGHTVCINSVSLPVSRYSKEGFMEKIQPLKHK